VRLLYQPPTFRFASPVVKRRKTPKDLCTTPLPPPPTSPNSGLHNILKIRKHVEQWDRMRRGREMRRTRKPTHFNTNITNSSGDHRQRKKGNALTSLCCKSYTYYIHYLTMICKCLPISGYMPRVPMSYTHHVLSSNDHI